MAARSLITDAVPLNAFAGSSGEAFFYPRCGEGRQEESFAMKKIPMLLLWLGAAISISEIFTGGMLASLGLARGLAAILAGHLIGAGFLAYAGYISFLRKANAMESVAECFGSGGRIIALCNVVQLLGWTIVMVVQAGSALTGLIPAIPFSLAALILALLVLIWALMFGSPAGQGIHSLIVVLLAILCVVLFAEAAGLGGPAGSGTGAGTGSGILENPMSLMPAIELSIAMPVSWLPLIGDYSVTAKSRSCAAAMPFIGYFTCSAMMYAFGLFIGVSTGGDIFAFIAGSRFSYAACAVVVLSTLTTAFLDLYSAAMSSCQIFAFRNKRTPIIAIGVFAAFMSAFFPAERYGDFLTGFLTAIGMVFVPVYTALFLDFITGKYSYKPLANRTKLLVAVAGMAAYRLFSVYAVWIPTLMSIFLVCALYAPCALAARGTALKE
jgi:putative hydroxymethylpyrimidine transporter CytX